MNIAIFQKKITLTAVCTLFLYISSFAIVISDIGQTTSQLEVYPGLPNDLYRSDRYRVSVSQNGTSSDSYVYMADNEFPLPSRAFMTDYNHWTSFSFSGAVTVSVTIPDRTTINTAIVHPKSRDIATTISENTVSFRVENPENVYVEIDGEEMHPIFIFANPIEVDVPKPDDPNVIYFGPGVHDIGETYNEIDSGTIIYIAGGAYVKGLLTGKINADPITIRGRGILSGIEYPHSEPWDNHLIELPGSQNQTAITIEGITMTNGPKTCVITRGATVVDNVKFFGFERNSDGISTGANSVIKNSFFKVNDDSIKLFDNNMEVFNNVIWQQPVGSIFQLSWNLQKDVTNIEVYDIDVIHFDRVQGTLANKLNGSVVGCRNLRNSNYTNVRFHDIRLEHQPYQLFGLQIKDDMIGFDEGKGSIQDVVFSNIISENTPRILSYLDANGIETGEIKNFEFCNVVYGGNKVSEMEDLLVLENQQNISNINLLTSSCIGSTPPPPIVDNIDPETQNSIVVYPNPAEAGHFWMDNDFEDYFSVDIYDQHGKLLLKYDITKGSNRIDTTGLSSGFYILIFYGVNEKTNEIISMIIK